MNERILQRFELAQEANPKLIVDPKSIDRVLGDYKDVPGLEGHVIDCAEWLGAQSVKRHAAPTLRNWLKDKRAKAVKVATSYGNNARLDLYVGWCQRRLKHLYPPSKVEAVVRAAYENGCGGIPVALVATILAGGDDSSRIQSIEGSG